MAKKKATKKKVAKKGPPGPGALAKKRASKKTAAQRSAPDQKRIPGWSAER